MMIDDEVSFPGIFHFRFNFFYLVKINKLIFLI